jgi:hypothetical protein
MGSGGANPIWSHAERDSCQLSAFSFQLSASLVGAGLKTDYTWDRHGALLKKLNADR